MSEVSISIPVSKLSFGFDIDEDLRVTKIYNSNLSDYGLRTGDHLIYFQGYMLLKKSDLWWSLKKAKKLV